MSRLISQLAHVELLTPTPEESLDFWTHIVGLELTATAGQSAFLRGWGDRFHHTLVLTEGGGPALGHVGWRAGGARSCSRPWGEWRLRRQATAGSRVGVGHGRAYRYRSPAVSSHEIFWEVERYRPPPALASPFPNRPQRFVPRGVAARCIDHVTVCAADPRGARSGIAPRSGTASWSTR